MTHLKRAIAPKNWKIQKKGITFIAKPSPGPHKFNDCITLDTLLKKTGYADTTREVKKILNRGGIIVDGIVRKNNKFPVGSMDIIRIPTAKETFRLLIFKDQVVLQPVKGDEATTKFNKIVGKIILPKKKIQLNLYDGRNILVKKDDFKVGDSVIFDLDKKSIKEHLKMEKGAIVYLIGGKYRGQLGKLQEVGNSKYLQPSKIVLKTSDNQKIETLQKYAFVVNDKLKISK